MDRLAAIKLRLDRPLTIVDVGCRWGFANIWSDLQPHVQLFGFDPDEEECRRLKPLYEGQNVELIATALADRPGMRTLYLTKDPACSSLYPPDPAFTDTMPALDCAKQARTVEIEVDTLDGWASGRDLAGLDFLKLDTQGSELDILRGAERQLARVRMLEVEVEFNPIYAGQPLFGDVDRFLRDRGFSLWKLSTLAHYHRGAAHQEEVPDMHFFDTDAVARPTLGGQLVWGHAYFVRREIADAEVEGEQATRDSALAHVLGFPDLSERLLARAN